MTLRRRRHGRLGCKACQLFYLADTSMDVSLRTEQTRSMISISRLVFVATARTPPTSLSRPSPESSLTQTGQQAALLACATRAPASQTPPTVFLRQEQPQVQRVTSTL